MSKRNINIAIIGASGMVGRKISSLLLKRNFPLKDLYLLGNTTVGDELDVGGSHIKIQAIDEVNFNNIDIAFFSAGSDVAKKHCETIANQETYVIDLSSFYRYEDDVPLIIPEINGDLLESLDKASIISSPNCSTAQLLMALKPIHDIDTILSINIATYQAVSGTGKAAVEELHNQTYLKEIETNASVYPKPIAFNVIPHCDNFLDNDFTKEEMKLVWETKKILDPNIDVTATCVRVPVFNGHSEAVFIKTKQYISKDKLLQSFNDFEGIKVFNHHEYPTPLEYTDDTEDVFIGRIRSTQSIDGTGLIALWIVADNVFGKGAALNAIQIAEKLYALNKV